MRFAAKLGNKTDSAIMLPVIFSKQKHKQNDFSLEVVKKIANFDIYKKNRFL